MIFQTLDEKRRKNNEQLQENERWKVNNVWWSCTYTHVKKRGEMLIQIQSQIVVLSHLSGHTVANSIQSHFNRLINANWGNYQAERERKANERKSHFANLISFGSLTNRHSIISKSNATLSRIDDSSPSLIPIKCEQNSPKISTRIFFRSCNFVGTKVEIYYAN